MRGSGKAHKSGLGAQLMARVNGGAKSTTVGRGAIGQYAHLFTTDLGDGANQNMQSVLDMSDLDEMMAMAELAGRSFAAERQNVTVVSVGGAAAEALAATQSAARRAAAEKAAGRLTVPRRPPWRTDMSGEELDAREREAHLLWRRDLALLEESDGVSVTPFEKNLQVWRQLWRVLERSDLVCQVLDSRDPLRYRCGDLEKYVEELGEGAKRPLLLLNKADLLPAPVRRAWAAYFDAQGVDYIFWSALAATEAHAEEVGHGVTAPAPAPPPPPHQAVVRTGSRVVGREELLRLVEARAAAAASDDGALPDPRTDAAPRRVTVGLVGYPNVGKSSTLNALVGSKRAGVGPTPGKTKHFQTFNISDTLMLADCPGLVFPSFSDGRAELVVAGVLPIDRLTDVVVPMDVIAQRISRAQLEATYSFRLPRPAMHEEQGRCATGRELLRAFAAARGLTSGAGLPDETRAGRAILKDYTSGKLLYCEWPPGMAPSPEERAQAQAQAPRLLLAPTAEGGEDEDDEELDEDEDEDEDEFEEDSDDASDGRDEQLGEAGASAAAAPLRRRAPAPPSSAGTTGVGNALLGELKALGLDGGDKGSRGAAGTARAEHKLQKKGKKEKLRRLARGPMAPEGVGGMLITGKRGGLMPASVQVERTPEFLPALMRHGAGVAAGGARAPTTSARPESRMSAH